MPSVRISTFQFETVSEVESSSFILGIYDVDVWFESSFDLISSIQQGEKLILYTEAQINDFLRPEKDQKCTK